MELFWPVPSENIMGMHVNVLHFMGEQVNSEDIVYNVLDISRKMNVQNIIELLFLSTNLEFQ